MYSTFPSKIPAPHHPQKQSNVQVVKILEVLLYRHAYVHMVSPVAQW